jgi:large subunit ribosomal protein L9
VRVVLRNDLAGVGHRGDSVDVAGGFARNYLFPRGHAFPATPGGESQATAMRRSRDLREARDRETAIVIAQALVGQTVTLSMRAGKKGRLFGSVTAHDIADAATAQKGVGVDRRQIGLHEPIKTVGSFPVQFHLFPEVEVEVTVEVVASA